jgi:hypothetical protein
MGRAMGYKRPPARKRLRRAVFVFAVGTMSSVACLSPVLVARHKKIAEYALRVAPPRRAYRAEKL